MSGNGGNSDESNTHIGNNKRRGLMPKGLAATVATLVSDLATDVANLAAHIAATVAHGATGAVVGTTNAQTLSNKTLITPTIANLTNMQHDHQGGAGGGTLTAPVIVSFTNAQHNHQHAAGGGKLDPSLALTEMGRLPYAYALEMPEQAAFTTVRTLAAAGGGTMFPIEITDWMFVQSLTIHTLNVASARSWEWRLYKEPNGGSATASEVAGINGTDSFTPGAATNRTSAATTPGLVAPGLYWVVLRCTHATNGLNIGTQATGVLSTNHSRIKSGLAALGSTIDISTGWTPSTVWVAGRLNGRVAGEAAAF